MRLFGKIPKTQYSQSLINAKILSNENSFDQKYVQTNLSSGRFLFDYIFHRETEHYRQLLKKISAKIEFINLDTSLSIKILKSNQIEGKYAYFIGGVFIKGVRPPITSATQPVLLYYKRKNFLIEWIVDPMFLISMTSILRMSGKNRYLIYCLIRSVYFNEIEKRWEIKASPLLIAQPTVYVNKTPIIAYKRMSEDWDEIDIDDEIDGISA